MNSYLPALNDSVYLIPQLYEGLKTYDEQLAWLQKNIPDLPENWSAPRENTVSGNLIKADARNWIQGVILSQLFEELSKKTVDLKKITAAELKAFIAGLEIEHLEPEWAEKTLTEIFINHRPFFLTPISNIERFTTFIPVLLFNEEGEWVYGDRAKVKARNAHHALKIGREMYLHDREKEIINFEKQSRDDFKDMVTDVFLIRDLIRENVRGDEPLRSTVGNILLQSIDRHGNVFLVSPFSYTYVVSNSSANVPSYTVLSALTDCKKEMKLTNVENMMVDYFSILQRENHYFQNVLGQSLYQYSDDQSSPFFHIPYVIDSLEKKIRLGEKDLKIKISQQDNIWKFQAEVKEKEVKTQIALQANIDKNKTLFKNAKIAVRNEQGEYLLSEDINRGTLASLLYYIFHEIMKSYFEIGFEQRSALEE